MSTDTYYIKGSRQLQGEKQKTGEIVQLPEKRGRACFF